MTKTKTAVATPFRVKFVYDEDGSLETPEGKPLPGTEADYLKSPIMVLKDPTGPESGERRKLPYAEYCTYYGNPDRHVIVGCIVEKRCTCCGEYKQAASLWNIDLMDDAPEWLAVTTDHWYTDVEALALPGYLGDVAKEQLAEAAHD